MPVGFEQPSQPILESIFLPSSGKIKGKAWIVPFVPSLGKSMVRTMNLAHEGDCRTDYQITPGRSPIQRLWIEKGFRPPILFGESTGRFHLESQLVGFFSDWFIHASGRRNRTALLEKQRFLVFLKPTLGIGSLGFLGQIKRCAERLFRR